MYSVAWSKASDADRFAPDAEQRKAVASTQHRTNLGSETVGSPFWPMVLAGPRRPLVDHQRSTAEGAVCC